MVWVYERREKCDGARLVGLDDGGARPPTRGLTKRGFLGLAGGFAPVKESAGARGEYLPTPLEVSRATGGAVRRTESEGSSPSWRLKPRLLRRGLQYTAGHRLPSR